MAAAACRPAIHITASPSNLCRLPQFASFANDELAMMGIWSTRKPPSRVNGYDLLPNNKTAVMGSINKSAQSARCTNLEDKCIHPDIGTWGADGRNATHTRRNKVNTKTKIPSDSCHTMSLRVAGSTPWRISRPKPPGPKMNAIVTTIAVIQ